MSMSVFGAIFLWWVSHRRYNKSIKTAGSYNYTLRRKWFFRVKLPAMIPNKVWMLESFSRLRWWIFCRHKIVNFQKRCNNFILFLSNRWVIVISILHILRANPEVISPSIKAKILRPPSQFFRACFPEETTRTGGHSKSSFFLSFL